MVKWIQEFEDVQVKKVKKKKSKKERKSKIERMENGGYGQGSVVGGSVGGTRWFFDNVRFICSTGVQQGFKRVFTPFWPISRHFSKNHLVALEPEATVLISAAILA